MRHYKRKSERAMNSAQNIRNAVCARIIDKKSLAATAVEFNIPIRSLSRYCKKAKEHYAATGEVPDVSYGYKTKKKKLQNLQQISSSHLQPTSSQNVFSNSLQPSILRKPQSLLKKKLPANFDEDNIFPNSEIVIKQEQNDDNILHSFTEVIEPPPGGSFFEPSIIIKEEMIEPEETILPDVTSDCFPTLLSSDKISNKTKQFDLSFTTERTVRPSKRYLSSAEGLSRVNDNLNEYLQHLGSKLRKLDQTTRLYVQNKIDDLLLQAQAGIFSDSF